MITCYHYHYHYPHSVIDTNPTYNTGNVWEIHTNPAAVRTGRSGSRRSQRLNQINVSTPSAHDYNVCQLTNNVLFNMCKQTPPYANISYYN